MSFSNIISGPSMASNADAPGREFGLAEPLAKAWALAKEIRQVPFEMADATGWLRSVRTPSRMLRAVVAKHVAEGERDESAPHIAADGDAAAAAVARAQLADHRPMMELAARLASWCSRERISSVGDVVQIFEQAVELEMLLARHHNRLIQLGELVHGGAALPANAATAEGRAH